MPLSPDDYDRQRARAYLLAHLDPIDVTDTDAVAAELLRLDDEHEQLTAKTAAAPADSSAADAATVESAAAWAAHYRRRAWIAVHRTKYAADGPDPVAAVERWQDAEDAIAVAVVRQAQG